MVEEEELANITEMINKLNSEVKEKHALLLEEKPTQPQPFNRSNEKDDVKKKLGKIEIFLFKL